MNYVRIVVSKFVIRARGLAFILMALCVLPTPSVSNELPKPSSEVLLTVDGKINVMNGNGFAAFDRNMLNSLGVQSITTENPFEKGMHSFEGVLIRDILSATKAEGTVLRATGLDGYTVQIPIEDVQKYPVMLAMVWNGEVMRVRNRGPLWVIYPLSDYPELIEQKYSARSVWQLKKLTVE